MKLGSVLFVVFLFFLSSCAGTKYGSRTTTDNFTGKIIYEYQFKDPATGKDVTNFLSQYFGKEQHYFINAKNYKAYDEKGKLRQLYNSESNMYYFMNPNNGRLLEMDGNKKTSEFISVEHSNETQEILGKVCNKLVVKTEMDKTIYWYSPKIAVSPENFKNHSYGGWNTYMKASKGALPLKFIVKTQNYTWISTATDIQKVELTWEDFNIENEISKN